MTENKKEHDFIVVCNPPTSMPLSLEARHQLKGSKVYFCSINIRVQSQVLFDLSKFIPCHSRKCCAPQPVVAEKLPIIFNETVQYSYIYNVF